MHIYRMTRLIQILDHEYIFASPIGILFRFESKRTIQLHGGLIHRFHLAVSDELLLLLFNPMIEIMAVDKEL